MSIFYRSMYTFSKNNQNYINALMKFNKNVWITHIDGVELDKNTNLMCKDLTEVIKTHNKTSQKKEIQIQCMSMVNPVIQ